VPGSKANESFSASRIGVPAGGCVVLGHHLESPERRADVALALRPSLDELGGIREHRLPRVVPLAAARSRVAPPMSISMASVTMQPGRAIVDVKGYRLQTTMEMSAMDCAVRSC